MRPKSTQLAACVLMVVMAACGHGQLSTRAGPVSSLDRAQARAQLERGVELLTAQGRLADAIQAFELASRADPHNIQAHMWAAWCAQLELREQDGLEHLSRAAMSDHPVAELAIWEAYRSFASRSQAERLAKTLAGIITRPASLPTTRARALHFAGHTLRYLGRFDKSQTAFDRLGFVDDWMLVGPFDNDQNAGFSMAFGPETDSTDFSASYAGKLRQIGWRKVEHFTSDGRVSLRALLDPSRWTTAYLVTWINSPDDRTIALRLAAFRGVKVWVNDRLLLSDDDAQAAALDQYVIAAQLSAGWNKVLVKVCQRKGPWQLGLRLTDLKGRPATGLHTDTLVHPYQSQRDDSGPLPTPSSLAHSLAQDRSSDFSTIARIHWSLRTGFTDRAVAQAVEYATRRPKNPLAKLLVARAHLKAGHQGQALKALREAETLVPGLPAAVIERVDYEKGQGRHERAMSLLAPLLELHFDLPAVRMRQIDLLTARGFKVDALREARTFARVEPDRAWTFRTIGAQHAALMQPERSRRAYERALELRTDHKQTYDQLINQAHRRGQTKRALTLLRTRNRIFPHLITAAVDEARVLLANDRYGEALSVIERLERIAPDFWHLHKVRGEILYRQGQPDLAVAAFKRSLDCDPDNPRLRDYLDYLTHKPDPVFERYALSEAQVEALLTQPSQPDRWPEAEAIFLIDDMVSHVFADGSAKHLVRQAYRVRNERGQRALTKFSVPASASFRLEVAETIQPDGSRQEATSIRRGEIHFPSLRPGSILHVAYRFNSTSSSWMDGHFADSFTFQGGHPVRKARWVLVTPANKDLKVLVRGAVVQRKTDSERNETINTFTGNDIPMLHPEAHRPPLRDMRAAVYVSSVPDWETLARWQNSLIEDQFIIDDEIRAKTDQLVQGGKSPMDKLQAIHAFVAKEVRYLNHDVGIFGKKPNKAANIFENRFGDCKDKATLMIAMLKHAGIKAHYAGVRTRDRGEVFWQIPNAQTNHVITYIPAQNGIDTALFVDATASFAHLTYLPQRDQGLKALVLTGQDHQILTTPMLGAAGSTRSRHMTARLTEDSSLAIEASERITGRYASAARSHLITEGTRSERFERQLNARYPGARLSKLSFSGIDDLSEAVSTEYSFQVPGRVIREGEHLRVQLLWLTNLTSSVAPKPERRYDLFTLHLFRASYQVDLQIPEGYTVERLPAPISIDHPVLGYRSECARIADRVRCNRTLEYKRRTLPRDGYAHFQQLCLRIDEAERQQVVLHTKKAGAGSKKAP